MTFPETLNIKVAAHELSFLLVTHTVYSDSQSDSYGILKSGWGAENFLDRLGRAAKDQVLGAEDAWNLARVVYKFHRELTQLSNAYSYAHFGNHNSGCNPLYTTTCGVQRAAIKRIVNDSDLDLVWDSGEIITFNLLLSFFDQVAWINATGPNHPHQNKRKQPAIADCTHTVAKALSAHVSTVLTWVVYL
jgi:hypothetical protein